jgi:hypothetical protein
MKIPIAFFLILLVTGDAWSQEQMTADEFKKLVATPGDSKALRKELASLPIWRDAKCSVTLKFQDGRVFKEEMARTAKTIDGNYVVFSVDSQFYKQPMHAILGYDDKALAINKWGLFGDTVTEETMMFDLEKISASTSTYAGGFMEITLGSFSDKEMSGRALAYKNGVLYLTREVKTWPIIKVEQDDAATGSQPTPSQTNGASSAPAPGR